MGEWEGDGKSIYTLGDGNVCGIVSLRVVGYEDVR